MFVVKEEKNEIFSLPVKELKPEQVKAVSSELAEKILKIIAIQASYPKEISKKINVHEQKVYYHIRNLEEAGIIKVVKKETKQGAVANYYDLAEPAFIIRFKDYKKTQKITTLKESKFLEPFIKDAQLDALIIVGSPDPHGPEKARSRDGYYGMDLALFIGTFLNYVPSLNVKLDTETREEDLRNNNLIILGGPIVNKITGDINSKLPIRFKEGNIFSTISNKEYTTDESALIVKTKSPFNQKKSILLIAGKRYAGTRAAIIAFLKHFKEIKLGNIHNKNVLAKVVEGVDLDSDGIVDEIEILE
jgi:DNA-binding transcriptional ArsR family regulator